MLFLDPSTLPCSTFACGPGQGHPQLRQTPLYQTWCERSHRAPDVTTEGLFKNATLTGKKLLSIPDDYTLFFFPGGATPAMDAVLWNFTKDSLSGLAFGAFSNRWGRTLAARLEPSVKNRVRFAAPGEFFPAQAPDYNASLVILTPNETSSGVQIPDDYLKAAWAQRGPDTLIAWDITSCAGGRDLPKGCYDILLFGLQKCFGAPGGTCAMALSPKAVKRLEEVQKLRAIPYTLDLSHAVEKGNIFQTVNTPDTTAIWVFYQACEWMLEHGGIPAMDALCRKHAAYLLDWAGKTDFIKPFVPDENFRSYTTPTFQLTDPRITDDEINAALAATGKPNLQDGIKRFSTAPKNTLRIACFPFIDINGTEEYKKLTAAVDEIVRQLRAK